MGRERRRCLKRRTVFRGVHRHRHTQPLTAETQGCAMQLKNEFNQTQEEINFLHRFHQRRCQSECGGSALCLFQRNQLGEHLRALPMLSVVCWEHPTCSICSLSSQKPEAAQSVKKREPGNSRKKCIALRRCRQRNFRANAAAAARGWSRTGAGQPQYSDKVNCS